MKPSTKILRQAAKVVAALSFLSAGSALAVPINVGGVIVDPDSPLDLTIKGSLRETAVSPGNIALQGYGRVTELNGLIQPQFCPTCELTFTFSYTLSNPFPENLVFTGGEVNFYVQAPGTFSVTDPDSADDGALWLSLIGHQNLAGQGGQPQLLGTLFGSLTEGSLGSGLEAGSGSGLLDVVGGLFAPFVVRDVFADNLGGFADMSFSSEFQSANGAPPNEFPLTGNATLQGDTAILQVAEPATLGLLGIGLFAMGWVGRRRSIR